MAKQLALLAALLVSLTVILSGAPVKEPAPVRAEASEPIKIRAMSGQDVFWVSYQGEITDEGADALVQAIESARGVYLLLELDSPGGSVSAGRRISRAIERSPLSTHCVADGQVASMASYVLQSCGSRYATWRSTIMLHAPAAYVRGRMLAQDLVNQGQGLEALESALSRHLCARAALPYAECSARFSGGREWHLDALAAHAQGLVDEVVSKPADVAERLGG